MGMLKFNASTLEIAGTLVNYGRIQLDTDNNKTSTAVLKKSGSYAGYGEIWLNSPATPEDNLQGFDSDYLLKIYEDDGGITYRYYYDALSMIRNQIDRGENYIDIPDALKLTLDGDLAIPEDVTLNAWQSTIVVSPGATLKIDGQLYCDTLIINGTVWVLGSGEFSANTAISTGSSGVLKLQGKNTGAIVPIGAEKGLKVQYSGGAKLHLSGQVTDNDTLKAYLGTAGGQADPNIQYYLEILNPCTAASDLTVPANTDLFIISAEVEWGDFDGSLTVETGATLTVNGYIAVQNASLTVKGTLENNSQITLERAYGWYGDCGKLKLDGGSYVGTGNIWVSTADKPDGYLEGFEGLALRKDEDSDGANYRLSSYTIHFDANGGSGEIPADRTAVTGAGVPLTKPDGLTRAGYVFAGWYNVMTGAFYGAEELGTEIKDLNIHKDEDGGWTDYDFVVLVAIWDPETEYLVKFDGNGAEGSMDDQRPEPSDNIGDEYRVYLAFGKIIERVRHPFAYKPHVF